MGYVEQDALSRDVTFQRKLAASLASAANAINSEAPATTAHNQRQILAQKVGPDALGWAVRTAECVIQANTNLKTAANTGGTTGPWTTVDADIDAGVSASWNLFAGVMT